MHANDDNCQLIIQVFQQALAENCQRFSYLSSDYEMHSIIAY